MREPTILEAIDVVEREISKDWQYDKQLTISLSINMLESVRQFMLSLQDAREKGGEK